MSDDMFFIPMIARALQQPDPRTAMAEAFERIEAMGQQPRYRNGYEQFLAFMNSVADGRRADAPEEAGALILEKLDRPRTVEVFVERDNTRIATCEFDEAIGAEAIAGIVPGRYRLTLETGRLVWEGELTEGDLLWSKTHPGEGLPMAADSEDTTREPTREMDLLEGTVVLRIYAGVEAGSLEITLTAPGGGG